MQQWDQERDEETLDTWSKRWSAGLFDSVADDRRGPVINKQMHIYVNRMSLWLKWSPVVHYLLSIYVLFLYIIQGPVSLALEIPGLALVTFASVRLSGSYSGRYVDDTEYPEWRKKGAAMEATHSGFLFLQWGTSYLLLTAIMQGISVLTPSILIFLFLAPIWAIWKVHKMSSSVELPEIDGKQKSSRSPTWRSKLLN